MSKRPRTDVGILDTNLVISLSRVTDPALLPDKALITTITLAELSVGPLVASTPSERTLRQSHLQLAEADFEPLPFDAAAARAFGRVAASLREQGRKPAARAFDLLIAAIAIANGCRCSRSTHRTSSRLTDSNLSRLRSTRYCPERPAGPYGVRVVCADAFREVAGPRQQLPDRPSRRLGAPAHP